jgi:hypothetical protein
VTVLHPFNVVFPQARSALESFAPGAILADTTGDHLTYAQTLQKYWDTPDDLIVIEQSIVVRPDILEEFGRCPSLWCTYAYRLADGFWTYYSLGCVKFAPELRQRHPEVPVVPCWDLDLCMVALFAPLSPCMHGTVEHLNERPVKWLWDYAVHQSRQNVREKYLAM